MRIADNSKIIKNLTRINIKNEPFEGVVIEVFYIQKYLFGLIKREESIDCLYPYKVKSGKVILDPDYQKDLDYLKNKLSNKN